jgi:mannose-1-phosphate guanylyltransferase
MLQHTFDRAERLIPRRKILTVVTKHHLAPEVCRQLADRAPGSVIVQPENKDTGPGILLPLTYLHKRCPEATLAVFPSDHFILEEDRFIDHVSLAARAVHHDPSQIVLLLWKPSGQKQTTVTWFPPITTAIIAAVA